MLQVGDSIIMKRNANKIYSYTKYKSTGTVVEVSEDSVKVDFDFMSGDVDGHVQAPCFWVDVAHCKLTKRPPQPTQQEKICAKIQLMEARWLAFQKKRLQANKRSCHV